MKGRFDLHIHSDTGILWHITSPHVPGLLANDYTIPGVLGGRGKGHQGYGARHSGRNL